VSDVADVLGTLLSQGYQKHACAPPEELAELLRAEDSLLTGSGKRASRLPQS